MAHLTMARKLEVAATWLDDDGRGVGDLDGRTYHVADLLPGEQAEVAIEHHSPHRPDSWARVVSRTSGPSTDRRTPGCPAAGRCGGCAWQHLAYPAQLAAKRARLERVLGDAVPAIGEVAASPAVYGYRNKGKYVVGSSRAGVVLGAHAPRTHEVVDTLGCRVVAPVIDEVAIAVRVAADRAGLIAYDEKTRRGELRYVIVRGDAAGGALVVLVVTSQVHTPALTAAAALVAEHPAVRGVVAMRNDRTDGAIVTDDTRVLHGVGALVEDVAGCPVEVGAGEFLQVHREQARALYARVVALALDGLPPGAHVADVYSGLGGIALGLARAGARVTAIESDAGAVAALGRAAAAGGLGDRVTPVAGDASALATIGPLDAVVVDPPRKGLSPSVRAALIAAAPARIVYVSCGPEALARDVRMLAEAGYRPGPAEAFDLMPGTAEVETVVALTR
jgi:23S rRNA (uracil1939-C5)-methyltransferase